MTSEVSGAARASGPVVTPTRAGSAAGGEGKAKREAMIMSRPIRHPFFHNVTAKVSEEEDVPFAT